jgi:ribosome-associated translation inhibitor RaiA
MIFPHEQASIASPALPAVVELNGRIAPDLVDYVQRKIAAVLRHTGRAALSAHVRIVRHADPARTRPVAASATIGMARSDLHVHADAATAREAVDLLLDRLDRRIASTYRHPRRRGGRPPAPPPTPMPSGTGDGDSAVPASAPRATDLHG